VYYVLTLISDTDTSLAQTQLYSRRQWRQQSDAVDMVHHLDSGRQEPKQLTNLFTCVRDFIPYTKGFEHIVEYCDRKQQNQKTTHAVLYMYSLLCVFISQYSNKVDFMWMGEAEMETKEGGSPKLGGQGPFVSSWSCHCSTHSFSQIDNRDAISA